jgi:hypothetical protein
MSFLHPKLAPCQPTPLNSKSAFAEPLMKLRANSKLKSSEYSVPVLDLIFLRYADHKFAQAKALVAEALARPTIKHKLTEGK